MPMFGCIQKLLMLRAEAAQNLSRTESGASRDNVGRPVLVIKAESRAMPNGRDRFSSGTGAECTTMAFITKLATKSNTEPKGVWSRYGKPYVPHGEPDLKLAERARLNKIKRTQPRRARTTESKRKKIQSTNANRAKKEDLEDDFEEKLGRMKLEVNTQQYRFPRRDLLMAEVRYRKARNGSILSKTTAEDVRFELGRYPSLDMSRVTFDHAPNLSTPKLSLDGKGHIRHRTRGSAFLGRRSRHEILPNFLSEKQQITLVCDSTVKPAPANLMKKPKGKNSLDSSCEKWHKDFVMTRKRRDHKLQESLVRRRMDLLDVFEDEELLGRATAIASHRAADVSCEESIWTQARREKRNDEIKCVQKWDIGAKDDRDRKDFYRELLVFVERRRKKSLPANSDSELIDAITVVKEMLENRVRFDDGTIFFETLQRFGGAVYEKKKPMEVLLFLRRKSGVTTSNLQSFVLQTGWHFPKDVATYLGLRNK